MHQCVKNVRQGAGNVRHGVKKVWHGPKNMQPGVENVPHGAENVRHGTENVRPSTPKIPQLSLLESLNQQYRLGKKKFADSTVPKKQTKINQLVKLEKDTSYFLKL